MPLFPIPVGSKTRLPDLDLLSVSAPTFGIVGENVQIPFAIRSSLDRQVRTIVRLRDDAGRERTRELVLPPNAEVPFRPHQGNHRPARTPAPGEPHPAVDRLARHRGFRDASWPSSGPAAS